ncbi:delta-lactam-biosynthetic de-N-acetylase [Paenibacillus physcomitrellae]|uniref:Delta-lactam-biosynthetic de-N-acetylase n=1 Tax=Paenibacillus physcomitrellae TaxID=1619311 RepID=A0ABQ1FVD9_9BACL|nr:delta-lactam-biosynthetic de-N-acetylase [Paenibacillus physcomitrellae]
MKRWTLAVTALLVSIGLIGTEVKDAAAQSWDRSFNFGFKRSQNGQLPSINEEGFKDIIDRNHAVFLGDTRQKEIYLTFDNGYENGYTKPILDTLKAKQVPAIFFVTGHYVKDQPELVKRMVAEGHLIGNHSWSHPDMSAISDGQIKTELERVRKAVAELTGVEKMEFVRPPRGIFSDRALKASNAAGYRSIFWSAAYKDWDVNDQHGAEYAYQKVMSQLHPGEVLLLHSVSKDNAAALARIIDDTRKQGYTFKALTELPKP